MRAIRTLVDRVAAFGVAQTLVYLYYWILIRARRHVSPGLCRRKIHSYEMLLDPADRGISTSLLLNGDREQQLGRVLELELAAGNVVVDLGANIGYYALLERSLIGASGKVLALEPAPANFELLKRNVELNNATNVEVFRLAGGSQIGTERFYLADHSNQNTLAPVLANGRTASGLTGDFIDVEVVDMSTFLAGRDPVNLIRMDIEGYEVEVLKGLSAAIESGSFAGSILFECHFPRYDDDTRNMRAQLQSLFAHGYWPKIMTSTDESKTFFGHRGYEPREILRTGRRQFQGLYYDVTPEDAEHFVCDTGGVRDVLLSRRY